MNTQLSEAEQIFILHGVEQGLRNDGRGACDYRAMIVETGVVSHACGSSKVRLGNSEVIAAVKAELGIPADETPLQGIVHFFVDCSANATPSFEGRGGDDLAEMLSTNLSLAYDNCESLDLGKLSLVKGLHCWNLHVDVVVLECGGALSDTIALAVKAALYDTCLPQLTVRYQEEKEEYDIEPDDESHSVWNIKDDVINGGPLLITVSKLGMAQVVDATEEEECCSGSQLIVGVTGKGHVTCVSQSGKASLEQDSVDEMIVMAVKVAETLNESLIPVLQRLSPVTMEE